MPLYEYQCEQCGDVFEVRQKFADPPLTVHEKCGGPVHRLISAPTFQFKGTGWYVTDYAKGSRSLPSGNSDKPSTGDQKSGSESTKPSPSSSTTTTTTPSSDTK